jgi:hypothetical protein
MAGVSRSSHACVQDGALLRHAQWSEFCYRDFGICWARSRPGGKVRSYGAPVCFRADFAASAEILMRCTVL